MAFDFKTIMSFEVKDQGVQAFFAKSTAAANKFGAASENSFGKAQKASSSYLAMAIKGIVAYKAIGAITGAIAEGGQEWLKYDRNMRLAAVQFDNIAAAGTKTAAGIKLTKEAQQFALQTSAEYGVKLSELSSAMVAAAKAGITSEQAMGIFPTAIKAAKIEGADLTVTVEQMTMALNTFGMASKDPLIFAKNFDTMANKISTAADISLASIQSITEAITSGGGAALANMLQEGPDAFLSVTAALAQVGLKGEEIGTVYRNMIARTVAATPEAAKLMDVLGITKPLENAKNTLEVVRIIGESVKNLPVKDQAAAFAELFGLRAMGAGLNVAQMMDLVDANMRKIGTSTGSVDRKFEAVASSGQMASDKLGVAFDQLAVKFLQTFDKNGIQAIDKLATAIANIDFTSIVKVTNAFAMSLAWAIDNANLLILAGIGVGLAWAAALWPITLPIAILTSGIYILIEGWSLFTDWLKESHPWLMDVIDAFTELVGLVLKLTGITAAWDALASVPSWVLEQTGIGYTPYGTGMTPAFDAGASGSWEDAPNAARIQLQRIQFEGNLNINGAPSGSTFTANTSGAAPITANMGVNP